MIDSHTVIGPRQALAYVPPPYVDEIPIPEPPRRPRRYSLLVLHLPPGDHDLKDPCHVLDSLRREFVMPVFVRPAIASTDADLLDFRDAVTGAGGEVLPPGTDIRRSALDVLTVRRDLAGDWLGWLRLHREVPARTEEVVRTLVTHSGACRSAEEALADHGISPRSARRWVAAAGLPAPRAWHRASRILRALLRLQRNPDLSVHDAARELGYEGADSFSNQMFRYFRHGAKKGRQLLGLERRFHEFSRHR